MLSSKLRESLSFFFFSRRRRHTRWPRDWSSDVCSSDLGHAPVDGDVIIGADGVASAIRRQLHPNEGPPRRSAYCAIRGVAYEAEQFLGDLSAVAYFAPGLES